MLDASGGAPIICCCAAAPVQHATKAIREFAIHETRLVMFSTHCCFEPIFVGWFDDNIKALPDCTRLIDRSERVSLFSGAIKSIILGRQPCRRIICTPQPPLVAVFGCEPAVRPERPGGGTAPIGSGGLGPPRPR